MPPPEEPVARAVEFAARASVEIRGLVYIPCFLGLFHITTVQAWARAIGQGEYRPLSLETEGFIHLSDDRQWLRTANRFFRGTHGLVLLSLNAARLRAEIRLEPADGDVFPHLYGSLNIDAVADVYPLTCTAHGDFEVPPALQR